MPTNEISLVTNRQLRRVLQNEAMRRRATILPYAPFEIYVDPCSACDLACTFCPQSNWRDRKRGLMPWDMFERVMDEVVTLKPRRVYLFCYGEALLNKDLPKMIKHGVDAGLRIAVHTNAKSMDAKKAKQLLDSGLSELHFSFDTADKEAYNRMRVGSDFDVVVANIRGFLEMKKAEGHEHPDVYVQELIPYEANKAAENSPEYRALFEGYDVTFDARFMHNFAGTSNEGDFAAREAEGESQCTQIYSRIVVTWDGKVHACCLDAFGDNIVGDLSTGDTIASSWNSEAMQRVRRLTNERKLEGLTPCDTCDVIRRKPKAERTGVKRLLAEAVWKIHGTDQ